MLCTFAGSMKVVHDSLAKDVVQRNNVIEKYNLQGTIFKFIIYWFFKFNLSFHISSVNLTRKNISFK
jgi:hypothetical protein